MKTHGGSYMTYTNISRHMTREQKRRAQRREAMLEGITAIGILLAIGFAVGRVV